MKTLKEILVYAVMALITFGGIVMAWVGIEAFIAGLKMVMGWN